MTGGNRDPWPAGSFVAELPDAERSVLLAAGDPYHFDDEHILLVQGEPGDFVYVLVSGLVKVVVTADSGVRTTLAIRSRGDLVGEFALLDSKPRRATASAIGSVTALRVRGSAFLRVVGQSPAAQVTVTRYLLAKMRDGPPGTFDVTFGHKSLLVLAECVSCSTMRRAKGSSSYAGMPTIAVRWPAVEMTC